jgi:hypothetical protein
MNYLYSGQPAHAWAELDRLYQGPYKVFLWSEIVRIASDSPFYTPAGSFPDLPVPDYYALQLGPGCVPDPHCASTAQEGRPTCQPVEWQEDRFSCARECAISFLQKGQAAGDPSVARRGIFWFEIQLSQLGVLSWEERLKVSRSEGGPCRIDIILEDTLRGHIELDTSGRFPGEVRRVNRKGRERASWRLRGDLTWEEVPP